MLWKSDHALLDHPGRRPAPLDAVQEPPVGEAFPTPGEVIGEMAATLAVFLAIALVMHVLVDMAGV